VDIQAILQHITKGNRQAFAPLVERYQRSLFSYLGRMGFSQAQAEDLAQETFIRAWQHLGQYDAHRAEFSTWLFTIARRLALNELERAGNRLETHWGEEPPDVASHDATPLAARSSQVLQAARNPAYPAGFFIAYNPDTQKREDPHKAGRVRSI